VCVFMSLSLSLYSDFEHAHTTTMSSSHAQTSHPITSDGVWEGMEVRGMKFVFEFESGLYLSYNTPNDDGSGVVPFYGIPRYFHACGV